MDKLAKKYGNRRYSKELQGWLIYDRSKLKSTDQGSD